MGAMRRQAAGHQATFLTLDDSTISQVMIFFVISTKKKVSQILRRKSGCRTTGLQSLVRCSRQGFWSFKYSLAKSRNPDIRICKVNPAQFAVGELPHHHHSTHCSGSEALRRD